MTSENSLMNIESLQLKIKNQNTVLKELTSENEELYHQYNHLIIRNSKMLKRIDDLQKIIDDLHIRIEELQLINGNMMNLNDRLRTRNQQSFSMALGEKQSVSESPLEKISSLLNLDDLFVRWKNFPGQQAQNSPNLRKQVLIIALLYSTESLRANELFEYAGIGGVTGARYISILKKYGMLRYTGARKKGSYRITERGKNFIEGEGEFKSLAKERSETLRNFDAVSSGNHESGTGYSLHSTDTLQSGS